LTSLSCWLVLVFAGNSFPTTDSPRCVPW
jgi:hypothetical protein